MLLLHTSKEKLDRWFSEFKRDKLIMKKKQRTYYLALETSFGQRLIALSFSRFLFLMTPSCYQISCALLFNNRKWICDLGSQELWIINSFLLFIGTQRNQWVKLSIINERCGRNYALSSIPLSLQRLGGPKETPITCYLLSFGKGMTL